MYMSPEVAAALWTGGITIIGSAITLIITNSHNKKMLNIQLENQSKTLDAQHKYQSETLDAEHKHQKELSIIQHSLDKRTEVVLEFRKVLEESMGILNYFHNEKADFERRQMLKAQYRNPHAAPLVKDDIISKSISVENMNNMFDHALQQITPVEDKLIPLEVSFNQLSVYLDNEEEALISKVVKEIGDLSHLIINGLRNYKGIGDPTNVYVLMFVHIGDGDPYTPRLKKLQREVKKVRDLTKRYVYVDRLED
jgi:hypothetical protein